MRVLLAAVCLLAVGCANGPQSALAGPTPVATPSTRTWLVSGQSNAVGCAEGTGPAAEPQVTMWTGRDWMPAHDPLAFMDPWPGCQVGPWVTAADTVSALTNSPIRLTGWGRPGVPLSLWDADQDGWRGLSAAIQAAPSIDAFLWWQGESDAINGTATGYASRLAAFVARVRASTRPDLRIVVIGLADSGYREHDASYVTLRGEQRAFVASDPHAVLVPAEGLPLNPLEPFHLSADGYAALGRRVADVLR